MNRQELESDIAELSQALIAADQQGDEEKARRYAKAYRSAKSKLDLMNENPGEHDPDSREYQDKYGAASGMSGIDKILAGVGKAFSDIGLGAQQRGSDIAAMLGPNPFTGGAAGRRDELYKEAESRVDRDRPLNEGAGLAGQVIGNIAAFLPAGGVAGTIPRAMALGATEGALQPARNQSELALNVASGGAFGAGGELLGRGLQRAVTPFTRGNSGRVQDAVDLLQREGVDLDVAQRTGSTGAQRVRSSLGDNPLTATRQQEFTDTQLRQFTRAVLRRIGVDADEATPDVLRGATQRIGQQIDDALESSPPVFDTKLASAIQRIQRSIPATLTDDAARPLSNNIRELFNAIDPTTGVISPAKFRQIRSSLSSLRRSTPAANELAAELEDEMLNALMRSGGDREGLQLALARWRNFRLIENSIDKGADKTISPLRLSNTLNQIRNRATSLRGLGHPETVELARLAEAGRSVLPETIGNSGTWGRALAGQGVLGAGGFAGALASGQDVGSAAAVGAGAATLPFLLQRGMLSQGVVGNYLAQGLPAAQGTIGSPLIQALLRQSAISGGLVGQ